jgi:hypothetical protein
MSDTADLLDKAADIIERDGWCQGKYASDPETGPCCALGAIRRAATGTAFPACDDDWDAITNAGRALARLTGFVPGWNDTQGRQAVEVTAALHAAAEKARAS